jgi:hypothetical protein
VKNDCIIEGYESEGSEDDLENRLAIRTNISIGISPVGDANNPKGPNGRILPVLPAIIAKPSTYNTATMRQKLAKRPKYLPKKTPAMMGRTYMNNSGIPIVNIAFSALVNWCSISNYHRGGSFNVQPIPLGVIDRLCIFDSGSRS